MSLCWKVRIIFYICDLKKMDMMKRNNVFASVVVLVVMMLSLVGCVSNEWDYPDYEPQYPSAVPAAAYEQYLVDSLIIADYMEDSAISAYDVDYGVYCAITEEGLVDTTLSPTLSSVITIKYKGYLIDGSVFDQTAEGASATFALSNLIGGWQIAFLDLTVGDKATLLIPSYYGYGTYASDKIPSSSVLLFDVELISFY